MKNELGEEIMKNFVAKKETMKKKKTKNNQKLYNQTKNQV